MCTFASPAHIDKCRLEAHVLDITEYHQALVPWRRLDKTKPSGTVLMRSSLPLEQRVLHDRTPEQPSSQSRSNERTPEQSKSKERIPAQSKTISDFTAFVRSAKARLVQDLKLLPTRGEQPSAVQRHNVTLYEDEPARQILLVYAPDNATQLEFVSLSLILPAPHQPS